MGNEMGRRPARAQGRGTNRADLGPPGTHGLRSGAGPPRHANGNRPAAARARDQLERPRVRTHRVAPLRSRVRRPVRPKRHARRNPQSHGADGGVDIWLWSQFSDKPVIVQCKHWKKRVVGVKELREFYGVLKSHDLTYGTFATSSTFSQDALAFAKDNRINAQDGEGLLRIISGRNKEQQNSLLRAAYEGEYWKPTCARCGVKMVLRKGRNQANFWGCVNYGKTKCRSIIGNS